MSEQTADGNGDVPVTAVATIEEARGHFMSAWQCGQRPRIEDALEAANASDSLALFPKPPGARAFTQAPRAVRPPPSASTGRVSRS